MKPTVTICIPTYRSEQFIARTLECARAQTHEAIRIVVSVDPGEDDTVDVCRRIAGQDRRIELIVQNERLGWSQNANAVLDRADTDFFFLYFHDDIISPAYVEKLVTALERRPDAFSAHCDLVEYGLADELKPAHEYSGPAYLRIVDFLMTKRGTTLRSMIRRDAAASGLRFPQLHGDNHWTAFVFHLRLLAAGNAVAVHEPLYRRWQREGSLTRSSGWQPDTLVSALRSQQQATELCLEIIEDACATEDERKLCLYCLRLFQDLYARHHQLRSQQVREEDISSHHRFLDSKEPGWPTGTVGPQVAAWIRQAERELGQLNERVRKLDRPAQ